MSATSSSASTRGLRAAGGAGDDAIRPKTMAGLQMAGAPCALNAQRTVGFEGDARESIACANQPACPRCTQLDAPPPSHRSLNAPARPQEHGRWQTEAAQRLKQHDATPQPLLLLFEGDKQARFVATVDVRPLLLVVREAHRTTQELGGCRHAGLTMARHFISLWHTDVYGKPLLP
jgi:hypothetical protein